MLPPRRLVIFRPEQLGLKNENSKLLHELSVRGWLVVVLSRDNAGELREAVFTAGAGTRSIAADGGGRSPSRDRERTAVSESTMAIATQAISTCTFRDRAKAAIGFADVTTTSVLPIQYRGGYDVALIRSTAPRYMFDMEWLG